MRESYFDGGLLGLIGYRVLAILITVFTLGIAFPYAYTLEHRWKTRHTVIEGRRLKFIGSGTSLFGHWVLWLILLIITLGIYGFWLGIALEKWKVKNTIFDPLG
ncbi:MAG: hypothetical protein ACRDBX_00490 [Erysipelotrichaceae bacterium]